LLGALSSPREKDDVNMSCVVRHSGLSSKRSPRLTFATLVMVFVTVLPRFLNAQDTSIFRYFSFSSAPDAAGPEAGVIRDGAGNFYGTTFGGGAFRKGTVFKLTRSGQEVVLYSFTGGSDGASPFGGLIGDANGNLYGTTYNGGDLKCQFNALGCGTVFKVDASGIETVLHVFEWGADGALPFAGLIRDGAGNLYGTTSVGGTFNQGTVFKVDANGNEVVLHSFANSPDAGFPQAGLITDGVGNLYGTTNSGGTFGNGTVYKISTSGAVTVLHSFGAQPDGRGPFAGLVRDTAGNLYGTTPYGGATGNGTVFKVDPSGSETVLYSFTGGADGSSPFSGLVLDAANNLYGTDFYGCGNIYKVDPTGNLTVLLFFGTGVGVPCGPYGSVIRDASGAFYGTTTGGGIFSLGTVYKFVP
jgi:uncharacterized repeat protein (TIGR03803 family)